MLTPLVGPALGLVLALGSSEPQSAPPVANAQSEPATGQRYASIEIDTSAVGEAGPIIQRRVRERGDVVLRDAGILPGRDASDPLVHIVVQEIRGDEPGFVYTIWTERKGEASGERLQLECTLCTESEIVARIEAGLTDVANELPVPVPTAAARVTADDETSPQPPRSDPAVGDDGGRRPLGAGGKAGIGLLAGGGVALGVGAALLIMPPKVDRDDPLYQTTTRPPGWAVLGSGAAAVIVGAVLLGLDRTKARRTSRTAVIAPWLGPRAGGVVTRLRF